MSIQTHFSFPDNSNSPPSFTIAGECIRDILRHLWLDFHSSDYPTSFLGDLWCPILPSDPLYALLGDLSEQRERRRERDANETTSSSQELQQPTHELETPDNRHARIQASFTSTQASIEPFTIEGNSYTDLLNQLVKLHHPRVIMTPLIHEK